MTIPSFTPETPIDIISSYPNTEFQKFNLFLKKLKNVSSNSSDLKTSTCKKGVQTTSKSLDSDYRDLYDEDQDDDDLLIQLEHHGFADFLHYQLGHLQSSPFQLLKSSTMITPVCNDESQQRAKPIQMYRQITDSGTNTKYYIDPLVPIDDKLKIKGLLVDDQGKRLDLSISYDTTYPIESRIELIGEFPDFQITKTDLRRAFHSIRLEIEKMIIRPISITTGYKWCYTKSSYRDKLYLLEYTCFQDRDTDMIPSKFNYRISPNRLYLEDQGHFAGFVECQSGINVGIQIFTKQFIITYKHRKYRHDKLIDLIHDVLKDFV